MKTSSMKKSLTTLRSQLSLFAIAMLAAACQLSAAPVISVNFTGDDHGPSYEYTVSGTAGVVQVGNWNNFSGGGGINGAGVHNNLLVSTGTASGTYINYVTGGDPLSTWGLGLEAANITDPNSGLFNNYLNYFNSNGIIYIGGLGTEFTSSGYDVIIYFADEDPGWQSYTVVDNSMVPIVDTRYGATAGLDSYSTEPFPGYFGSTAMTSGDATLSNYVTLSGFSGDGFYIVGNAESGARPAITGFQIIAVPEPTTLALLGAGIGFVLLRRRK